MSKKYALALLALVVSSVLAQAAPVKHDATQWPTDYRTENSGDFQLQGR